MSPNKFRTMTAVCFQCFSWTESSHIFISIKSNLILLLSVYSHEYSSFRVTVRASDLMFSGAKQSRSPTTTEHALATAADDQARYPPRFWERLTETNRGVNSMFPAACTRLKTESYHGKTKFSVTAWQHRMSLWQPVVPPVTTPTN